MPVPRWSGVDLHRLELGTEASLGLEMSEDQELGESDHLAATLGPKTALPTP